MSIDEIKKLGIKKVSKNELTKILLEEGYPNDIIKKYIEKFGYIKYYGEDKRIYFYSESYLKNISTTLIQKVFYKNTGEVM